MARGDELYARLEVSFIRGFRWLQLPPGARCLYLTLWCYALENRRSTIARPPDYILASIAGLPHHPIPSYLRLLDVHGLCSVNDVTIEMIGIEEKHQRFQWKQYPVRGTNGPHTKTDGEILDTETDTETDNNCIHTRRGRTLKGERLTQFLKFWDAFDYKKGRSEAADAFLDIQGFDNGTFEKILKEAKREATARPNLIEKGHTPKMAQGWLSGRRWEDEGQNFVGDAKKSKGYSRIEVEGENGPK